MEIKLVIPPNETPHLPLGAAQEPEAIAVPAEVPRPHPVPLRKDLNPRIKQQEAELQNPILINLNVH